MLKVKHSKGPFRGPAPKGLYQTIDLAAGPEAWHAKMQAKKLPSREYLAVDFKFDFRKKPKNLHLMRKDALTALKILVAKKKKTRHIQISMPVGRLLNTKYLEAVAKIAKKVLIPNGKIHIITPVSPKDFEDVIERFKKEGFSYRLVERYKKFPLPLQYELITDEDYRRHIERIDSFYKQSPKAAAYLENYNAFSREYEFTYRLKTAIPRKRERRKWP
ncbi:MAG: hypothetical protein HYW05_03615 [Candidatus Diapherotrites archaeon]|nr:hypothetical protein [Candidatus Diapherotrites archaeon]